MRPRLPNSLLAVAAVVCFVESFRNAGNRGAEPLLTLALGIILLLRGLAAEPLPAPVIVSGCALAAISVAEDRGIINANAPLWIGLFIAAGAVVIFWQRIEKFWK